MHFTLSVVKGPLFTPYLYPLELSPPIKADFLQLTGVRRVTEKKVRSHQGRGSRARPQCVRSWASRGEAGVLALPPFVQEDEGRDA